MVHSSERTIWDPTGKYGWETFGNQLLLGMFGMLFWGRLGRPLILGILLGTQEGPLGHLWDQVRATSYWHLDRLRLISTFRVIGVRCLAPMALFPSHTSAYRSGVQKVILELGEVQF